MAAALCREETLPRGVVGGRVIRSRMLGGRLPRKTRLLAGIGTVLIIAAMRLVLLEVSLRAMAW